MVLAEWLRIPPVAGLSATTLAARQNFTQVVELLIEHGAEPPANLSRADAKAQLDAQRGEQLAEALAAQLTQAVAEEWGLTLGL